MPSENCKRLGYFGDTVATRQFCDYYTKMNDVELFKLKDLPLKRWNFGGEFFEAIIIEDDDFLDKAECIKMVKKALQENQNLIFISEKLGLTDVESKLEAFGFSDFTTVETEPYIYTAKKWFAY